MKSYVVVDLFCGAGGSSTGAKEAIEELGGEMVLAAVNHWNTAIATHQANHPTARHLLEDVSLVDPETVVEGGYVDILMASPECKFHSRARGGKPIHDQGRMNAWAVHNWLTTLDVRCVLIENVPEFIHWGPVLANGQPDKSRKGQAFQAWFLTFHQLGYQAEWRMLNAADYGDATTRTRFFLLARKDGRPVIWPEPSHSKEPTGMFTGRKRWRGAREIIDWTNPGRSILDDPKYLKKPLSEKTRQRIARGLERFGGPLAPLYIRLLDLPDLPGLQMSTNGSANGSNPKAFHSTHRKHVAPRGMDDPLLTITTENRGYIVIPGTEPLNLEAMVGANRNQNVPKPVDCPVPVLTTTPFTLGQQSQGAPRPTEAPVQTITTAGAISLIQPSVVEYGDVRDIDSPLNHHGLPKPMLVEYYGRSNVADVDQPLPTATTKDRHGLATPSLVEVNHGDNKQNNGRVQSVDEPLKVVTAKRGVGLVSPLIEQAQAGNIDPRRLIIVDGTPHLLDIRFRMLQNGELAKAMGFEDEKNPYKFVGNVGEITRQVGNAVPVHLAAALVRAVLE